MFSLLLTRLSSALEAYSTGPYTFDIYDSIEYINKSIVKKAFIKVAHTDIDLSNQDKVKDISDLKDELDFKITTENDYYGDFTIIRLTLTNIGSVGKRYDVCTAILFAGDQERTFYSPIPNFGTVLFIKNFDTYTWVQQNHPQVTNGKLFGRGTDDNVKFFTDSRSDDAIEYMDWVSESWTNNYIEPGQTVTLSFMIHKNYYDPPLLHLEKNLISNEYEVNDKIHIKGSFSYYFVQEYISVNYNIVSKETKKTVRSGTIKIFITSRSKMSEKFDIEIGPFAVGSYTLYVYTRHKLNMIVEAFDITVYPENSRPKVTIFWPEYKYYIPETEITIQGYVSDPDSRDKTIATAIYFNGKVIQSSNITNDGELKTFKFSIPKDTPVGQYDIMFTANDGRLVTERNQTIFIRDNTVLSIDVEPELKQTYKKGDKLNFTAVVNDPDTDYESNFVIFVYYKDSLKLHVEKENKEGIVRVPLQLTIPNDETANAVTLKIKVTSSTEKAERGFTFSILDENAYDKSTEGSPEGSSLPKQQKILIAVFAVITVLAVILAIIVVIVWLKK